MFPKGVNVIGYTRSYTGLGEASRLLCRSLETANIKHDIINVTNCPSGNKDFSMMSKEVSSPKYFFHMFYINASHIQQEIQRMGLNILFNRYNIGFWHWELPDFPLEYSQKSKLLHEIWVPSKFVEGSIKKSCNKPVTIIPHCIKVDNISNKRRLNFKLPKNAFLFLFMYDACSVSERKNPEAVINAFKMSFKSNDMSVGLVIKTNHSSEFYPAHLEMLKRSIQHYKNIYITSDSLPKDDVNCLINLCDSFVSLHRSEGFGLGLAEAMYLGKPVIATNWSGNTDFTRKDNSCLVNYRLIPLGKNYGPYDKKQIWADADVEHASDYMKKLVNDPTYKEEIGKKGQETIQNEYSPSVIGKKIKNRLNVLRPGN